MRRQLSILLFLAILLASLGTALVVALSMHRELVASSDAHVSRLHDQLRDRFHAFDLLLAEQEQGLNRRLEGILPRVAQELEAMVDDPLGATPEQLDLLSDRHGVSYLYLIDRAGRVVATNFAPDLGLDLAAAGEGMRQMFERLYGSGQINADRFNASIHTGRLYKYAYYGPRDRDYILEAAVDLRHYLQTEVSPRMDQFLFRDLLRLGTADNGQVTDFDLFIATEYGGWSLWREGRRLEAQVLAALYEEDRVVLQDNGSLAVYEHLRRVDADGAETDSLITLVAHDRSDQERLLMTSVGFALLLAMALGMLAFLVARVIMQRSLLRPVLQIVSRLDDVSRGEFRRLPTTGVSELDVITRGVNTMLERIDDREERLLEAKHELERRVQERTAALESLNEQLAHLATTDPLTGLANRRSFFQAAERELGRARRAGYATVVAMLDLDHFKDVNDTHGHAAGDRILELVSRVLVKELRDADLVGRLGGEEFGLLLVDVSVAHAREIVERIRTRVMHCDTGLDLSVTLSAGIADCDPAMVGLDVAMALADRALYEAKHQGRNRVITRAIGSPS
ncbi:diguanylate cyclase [Thioalkalivibrio sulfidiphilus]|uniref:diguanylate cyclase n=1 Tax=Thioalkalivibrio sulfidiphilus TaxID=1033854 RepID=UPI000372F383|nr:diguanylate cyclase [Thioalkalivibrio sulfidiphilus]